MEKLVSQFREHVVEISNSTESFRHRSWFVPYHLEIVEKIALEACELYPNADTHLVRILVWLHDYGKIIDFDTQYATTLTAGQKKKEEIGFPQDVIAKSIHYLTILDSKEKEDLGRDNVPIEVKIVSSADGASHLVGPFFFLWWHENPNKPYKELMADNPRIAMKDWNKKIVLPEIRKAFENRHSFLLEQTGAPPEKFL